MPSRDKGHTRNQGWLDILAYTYNLSEIRLCDRNVLPPCDLEKPPSDLEAVFKSLFVSFVA